MRNEVFHLSNAFMLDFTKNNVSSHELKIFIIIAYC